MSVSGKKKSSNIKSKPKRRSTKSLKMKGPGERTQKIFGIILLFFSFILLLSFVSYINTFQVDRSEMLNDPWTALFDKDITVKNSMGRLGAFLSHLFIYRLFGFASFIIIALITASGLNVVFQKRIFNLGKLHLKAFVALIWFCTVLAFAHLMMHPSGSLPWGGGFGEYLSGPEGLLTGFIKPAGTAALIFVTFLSYIVWKFNVNFSRILDIKIPGFKKEFEDADLDPNAKHIISTDESLFEKDQIESTAPELSQTIVPPVPENKPENSESGSMDLEITQESAKPAKKSTTSEEDPDFSIEETVEEKIIDSPENKGNYDPTLDLSQYKYPSLDLLEVHGSEKVKIDSEELERNKNQIIQTLNNYNIQISKIKATIGPTVTLYEIVPAPGVRISKIKNLEDDIALSLAALGIRIIAPIPGKGTVGIEVPNVHKETVSVRTLLSSEKFRNTKMELPISLGKTISNEIFITDLAKMPHLLVAGATGQGKSVGINAIIVSLLYHCHPSQLKFVLVDPKKVELSLFNSIEKHFLAKLPGEEEPIITDTKKVVNTLNALCIEMDTRYDLLKQAYARNIKEYNKKFVERKLNPEKGHRFLPYIVLVVDEFADLIMTAGKEVEMPIGRLAQLARAIGIHLILATQRPSVNIITGTIKANFPARISFRVTSKVDSRTILDQGGAEQLIGRGDMLLTTGGDLIRIQCGFVDTPEVDKICNFIADQQGYPDAFLLPEYIDENEAKAQGGISEERDPLFEDAARVIVQNQQGSTSMIQRRLKLGYNRAGRLMDQLEDAGIVGPNRGSKAREVLFNSEMELEQYLQSSNTITSE
ncbi:MAG: DNA translocase FtsK [Chitinophagales bacterium]|nr:DNA translocase FtsK [Chitinophagales bacterium]